ncbi:hypothetical protein P154DRAFT_300778 [Amniculicola lignicola CBS 123094]|uniref:Rhodopsin domain-containing protein n=1 Tax=Amniculicola lignicola CBS 123094 TaxID=1392246 RepID=A0A6A5WD16_9PLEO|nr:hypothetical protein P154DRAFT_300778 [Amniculicola lignicola CBS 123094]
MARVPTGEPPGSNVNLAPVVLGVTGSLYLILFALFAGRICTRLQFRKLGWDDLFLTLGLISALTQWALFMASTQYGAGRHSEFMDLARQGAARQLLFTSSIFYSPSITLVKICIAWMLLRLKHTRPWAFFLWSLIVVQVASCTASLAFQLLECAPSNQPTALCANPGISLVVLSITSTIGVCFNLILAGILFLLLRDPRRPLRDRIVISVLVCLATFAAAANLAATIFTTASYTNQDVLYNSGAISLWRIIEEQVAIIAACIPCLNFLFERSLRRLGFLPSIKNNTWPSSTHSSDADGDVNAYRLSTLRPTYSAMSFTISAKQGDAQDEAGDDVSLRSVSALEGGIIKTTEFRMEEEVLGGRRDAFDVSPMSWKLGEIPQVQGGWSVV